MNEEIKILVNEENVLVGDLIHVIDKYILSIYNKNLKEFDINFQQAMIILFIYSYNNEGKEIYQKDLEQLMGLSNPTITTSVKTMMRKDLVYRIQSENDGRYYHLHLTVKSFNIVEDIAHKIFSANESFSLLLSNEENNELFKLLTKLSNNIKKAEI